MSYYEEDETCEDYGSESADDDEMSPEEQAFMRGYNEASNEENKNEEE